MDRRIRESYNDSVLNEALARYGVVRENARLLNGFENFVYEYEMGGKGYILRISHSLHRTSDATRGEVEWLNYLVAGGVPAARAVPSQRGNVVEPIPAEDGSHFTAVSFERAQGDYAADKDWESGLAVQLGQIVGRMHALTKDFQPSDARFTRHQWHEDYPEGFVEQYLPSSETVVIAKFSRLLEHLHTLPRERDSYGLIHVDVNSSNFFVHDGQITLFDFDDCQYAWFAYDVAMVLFYAIAHDCVGEEDVAWARRFFEQFMEGYRRVNTIAPEWLNEIPCFLKLREIDLYVLIHRSCDLDDLAPWCASFMRDRKRKIENDVPYVGLDWKSFA